MCVFPGRQLGRDWRSVAKTELWRPGLFLNRRNSMEAKKLLYGNSKIGTYSLLVVIASLLLTACMAPSEARMVIAVSSPSAVPTSSPAPTARPTLTSTEEEITSTISAIVPLTIYSGPGKDHPQIGILEAGASGQVSEFGEGNWLKMVCPDGMGDSCWIMWDPNAFVLYEGPAVTLNIPDLASLKFETVATESSADGRWQALVTRSEAVSFIP